MRTPALAPLAAADRPLFGIALRFGAASCFAIMAAILKLAGDRGVNAPEMILYRNAFGLPLITAWVLAGPGLSALRTRRPAAHLTRAGIGLLSMAVTFEAIILLPLPEATTITFAAPVVATILSVIVLGEVVHRRRWFAVALGFAGVLVVMRPGSGSLPALGVACAIAAAVGQASVAITLRQIGRTETTAAIVFWFTITTTLVMAALLPWFGHHHDVTTWLLLVAAGLVGGTGQLMMTASLRHAPVAVLAPIDYIQILWATLFGWLLFAHPASARTLLGGMLVIAGGVITAWREHRLRRVLAATPIDQ